MLSDLYMACSAGTPHAHAGLELSWASSLAVEVYSKYIRIPGFIIIIIKLYYSIQNNGKYIITDASTES